MKKGILCLIGLIFLFLLSGCMVTDDDSFAITVYNYSAIDVIDIKVGKANLGNVLAGQAVTYKFFEEEKSAPIVINGFSPYLSFLDGEIDLKKGYIYTLELRYDKVTKKYVYKIEGVYYSDSDKYITMK